MTFAHLGIGFVVIVLAVVACWMHDNRRKRMHW